VQNLLLEKLGTLQQVGISSTITENIRAHIETADPPGLQNISAFRMAEEWGMPRQEVLEAFLYGTRLGLFDLTWTIRCPSCKGLASQTDRLVQLASDTHCEYCDIDIRASFDQDVEVTFRVNDNIRQVEEVSWFELINYWGEMDRSAQFTLAPGEHQTHQVTVTPGTWYVAGIPLTVEDAPTSQGQTFGVIFEDADVTVSKEAGYHPGSLTLALTNQAIEPIQVSFWYRKTYPWTSAAEVAATQSFRDLFSSELISADETFSIRSQVIVFTDIKGSTALYERLGDSDAYYLVKEHFKILTQQVKAHRGAIVKTIGDAVMATFLVSQDAIEALFAMQEAFNAFNAQENVKDEIVIKVGAHRGPCIAVNSNDLLDYFGHTVNIASRVQGLSQGRDIMVTRSFFDEPSVRAAIDASGWRARHFQAVLRGIEDHYDLVHLTSGD
jgi:class 3 adenylate cyclase